MRVLYLVHQYFPRSIGGTEIYTHGLARRAQAAGHEVRVVATHESPGGKPDDFQTETSVHENIPLTEIHFNLSLMSHPARAEYSNPLIGRAVAEQLRAFRPDVVHAMHAMKLSAAALEACYEQRVPVIVTLCDFWFLCPRHTLLKSDGSLCSGPNGFFKCVPCVQNLHGFAAVPENARGLFSFANDVRAIAARPRALRRALLKTQRIIALSNFAKDMFVQNGFPATRMEVIPHGLEIDDLTAPGVLPARQDGVLRVGFIGSLVPHKGAHLLLEALTLISEATVEVLIYGAVPENDYGRDLRAVALRDARVRLMGTFEPCAMGEVLRSFDVLAMPALWYENQPLVIKAAQHVGVPVLASAIGSLPEMIENGVNGWLVERSTPQAWAENLARLVSTPLPNCKPQRVKTMDENALEMMRIYEEVSCYDVRP
jgi:glycosyltransferase involved in cell wall biosynthesis